MVDGGDANGGRYPLRSSSNPASPLKDITKDNAAEETTPAKRYSFRTRRPSRNAHIMESDEEDDFEEEPASRNYRRVTDLVAAPEASPESLEEDEVGEDHEEDDGTRRYPRRNRTSVVIYDPYEEPTVSRRRRGNTGQDHMDEEEEVLEDERMKPFGRYSAHHGYSTRFRREPKPVSEYPVDADEGDVGELGPPRRTTRVRKEVKRYTPFGEQQQQNQDQQQSSPRKRLRRIQRQRDRDYGREQRSDREQRYSRRRLGGDSDDDLIQDRNDHLWGLLAEAAQQDAAAANQQPSGMAPIGNPLGIAPPSIPADLSRAFGFGAGGAMQKQKSVEITPVTVDASITFSDIGGLEHYVHSLKEMVFLPLVYPEVFRKFHLNPPKGVLLHGPPGTGKTLCARALAAAAKRSGQNVSFFMRKGADVLSKWVGESERQLRLLFEEAQKRQPSIIFFDEIDGLCPVRSSKQDQIHNSIVSTLLALMDGLDNRGQVVVIGATNRIDAVDSALRRPGRFDRELSFPLPNVEARKEILGIYTKKWQTPMEDELKEDLATTCVGYCGADLKALCTEATLQALRRHYPQIYRREEKLLIDTEAITIQKEDFESAQKMITPASQRSAVVHAKPLPKHLCKGLSREMGRLREACGVIFNPSEKVLSEKFEGERMDYAKVLARFVCRSRICVCGGGGEGEASRGMGQDLLASSLLHDLESLPCFAVGHPDLLAFAGAHTPEEALVSVICEARKAAPSILYLPNCDIWWSTSSYLLRSTFLALMSDLMSAEVPVLFLATCDSDPTAIPEDLAEVFFGNLFRVAELSIEEKEACFEDVLEMARGGARETGGAVGAEGENLPLAPPEEQVLRGRALELKMEEEEEALRQHRMVFRNQVLKLLCEHRWRVFAEPLREEEKKMIEAKGKRAMDLLTILRLIDTKDLCTGKAMEAAVADLVATTEILYSPTFAEEARIISRAHALKDTVGLWLKTLAKDVDAKCVEIMDRREAERLKKEEEEAAGRRVSSRRAGDAVEEGIQHLDPEAVARRLRQEKRQAEEQAAREAEALRVAREEEERERAVEMEKRTAAAREVGSRVEAGAAADDLRLALRRKLEALSDQLSLSKLNTVHACLKQLTWSYRREQNRKKVCEELVDFLSGFFVR